MFKYFREKRERERRNAVKVLGWVLVAFGVSCVFFSIANIGKTNWPKTIARVTETEVEKLPPKHHSEPSETYKSRSTRYDKDGNLKEKYKPKPEYKLLVGYKYTIEGEEFTNRDSVKTSTDSARLESTAKNKYPVNKKIQVAYDPGDHTNSTLHPTTWTGLIFMILMGCGMSVGGFILGTKKDPQKVPSEDF